MIILQVVDRLGLTFGNSQKLDKIINSIPNRRPKFLRHEFEVEGHTFEIHSRNALKCVEALYGAPEFAKELIFTPERHYIDEEMSTRVYHEMNTGDWWWKMQVRSIKTYLKSLLKTLTGHR